MAQMEQEDGRDGFEQYPHPQRLGEELRPREPGNAELEAARSGPWPGDPTPQKTNWPALLAVVAFLVVFIAVTFIMFPLDTWEFRFGP
jgi:hypothetical protein